MALEFTPTGKYTPTTQVTPEEDGSLLTPLTVPCCGTVSYDGEHHGFYDIADCSESGRLVVTLSRELGSLHLQFQGSTLISVTVVPGRFTTVWNRIRTNNKLLAFRNAIREQKQVGRSSKLLSIYRVLDDSNAKVLVFIPEHATGKDIAPDPRRYIVVRTSAPRPYEYDDTQELETLTGRNITVVSEKNQPGIDDSLKVVEYNGQKREVLQRITANNGYIFVISGDFPV